MATDPQSTLGSQLASDRLRHRATRLQMVVAVLRERAQPVDGGRPTGGLLAALEAFEAELRAVRAQLHKTRQDAG
jgi:hypothetical protein